MGIINIKAVDDDATDKALASAGMLYYCYGLTQSEIAKRMQVSRSTVSNYLRSAREQGIVDIRINGRAFKETQISRQIREHFGLTDAYISDIAPNVDASGNDRQIAILAAMALRDILQPSEKIGVAWSDMLWLVASEVPAVQHTGLEVFELMGGSGTYPPYDAETSASKLAARLPAKFRGLRYPAVASSEELAALILKETAVQNQLSELSSLNRYVFSVETLDTEVEHAWSWLLRQPEADAYRSNGAVALVCGQFLDQTGTRVSGPLDKRLIGLDFETISGRKNGLLMASGADKAAAVLAVLNANIAEYLFVDRPLGEEITRLTALP